MSSSYPRQVQQVWKLTSALDARLGDMESMLRSLVIASSRQNTNMASSANPLRASAGVMSTTTSLRSMSPLRTHDRDHDGTVGFYITAIAEDHAEGGESDLKDDAQEECSILISYEFSMYFV